MDSKEPATVSFNWEALSKRVGVPQDQIIQNLNSYMESAYELMKKYPNKKMFVDLTFAKLAVDKPAPKEEIPEVEENNYTAQIQHSLTKEKLHGKFGHFKRNPSASV